MKKLFLILCAAILFTACNKYKDYDTMLQGNWLCQEVNNLIVPTNKAFVMVVGEEKAMVAFRADTAWTENTVPFLLDKEKFTITDGAYSGEYKILSLSESKLRLEKNNVRYTLFKMTKNYESDLVGNWYSVDSDGNQIFDVSFNRPNFNYNDGNIEISGTYRMYGDFLVLQYSENQVDKVSCWLIAKNDDGFRVSSYFAMAGSVNLQEQFYNIKRK